jgi:hypothetical protein
MKTRRVAPACLLALALMPARVLADPIPVTSGFFSVTGLGANALFEFDAPDFRAAGNLEPGVVGPDLTCFPCAPGDVISLDTRFLASPGAGTATVDGTVFPLIGFSAFNFLFEAPDIVAPGTAGSFTVTRPFSFSGRLSGFDVLDPFQTPNFQRLLIGQGQMTASFKENPNPGGPPLFVFHSIRYDFAEPAPVPEPATFLLAATGLAATLRLRRRARRTLS